MDDIRNTTGRFPDNEKGIMPQEDIDAVISLADGVDASFSASNCGLGDYDDERLLVILFPMLAPGMHAWGC